MIDGGVGVSQLNVILSALDIPSLSTSTLKRYEKVVGSVIETVARNSCRQAIKVEKSLTIAARNPQGPDDRGNSFESSNMIAEMDREEIVKIAASYDAG